MEYQELERIAKLLRSCLQQIERDAMSVQHGRFAADPEAVMTALQGDTERLRGLLHSLLGYLEGPLDLNAAVREAIDGLLRELEVPLVVDTRLGEDLPGVRWPREALHSSLRRALKLAARHCGSGGEIEVTTRPEGDLVLFELTAGGPGDPQVRERCETLEEFVDRMEGRCELRVDGQGRLRLLMGFQSRARVEGG